MRIIIIGAGVIGTTTAWYLHRAGHQVHVIDRAAEPASETSFANGGLLHASHAEPWNAPGVVGQLLRWIGREESPLLLRAREIPRLTRWGLGFLRNSSRSRFERNTVVNTRLAIHSLRRLQALRRETGIRYADSQSGIIKIFRDAVSMEKALQASRLTADLGLRFSVLDPRQATALEPALADVAHELTGAIYYPDDESGDACLFTRRLAALAQQQGVEFEQGVSVERLQRDGDRLSGLITSAGPRTADLYILAAGSYSPGLARQVGLRLPIYPVKGYSHTAPLNGWRDAPTIPMIDDANKVVMSILDDRIRMAGTAEFAGFDTTLEHRRADNVFRQVLKTFPTLEDRLTPADLTPWCGLRPPTMDGPPILGPTPIRNLQLNTGAGHLGWTFACGAASLVAESVAGSEPSIPLDGLGYDRFA